MRSPLPRRGLLALPSLLARPARAAPRLRIGSKNFTEQLVVAELFAQGLEKAGATVERRVNLGGTAIAQAALLAGEIDLYPEYTGTGLGVVLKQPPVGSAAEVLAKVRAGYRDQFNLTWLDPSGIDNGNALLLLPKTAQRLGLATLSAAAEEFNRYNRRRLVIDDPVLARRQFVGLFRTDDPHSFALAVAVTSGARLVEDADTIRLR